MEGGTQTMCAKLKKEQLDSLQYRESRLARLQARLTRLMSGEEASFLPLVRTKGGAHSEKKTRKLIEELIDTLQRAEQSRRLDRATGEFFRAYLYCLLRLAADGGDWAGMHGRFTDLIWLAENSLPHDEVALHYLEEEMAGFLEMSEAPEYGFFFMMDALYGLFTGKYGVNFTDAEYEAIRRRYPPEEQEGLDDFDFPDLPDSFFEDLPDDYVEAEADWESEYRAVWEEEIRQEEEKWRRWAEDFAEKDALCEAYEIVRKRYFAAMGDRLLPIPDRIRGMLTLYLAEHGQSLYTDDERFFAVYSELNKTVSSLQSQQKREG